MTLNETTISGGVASAGSGGGVLNGGTATLTHSTVSGNSANFDGGGVHNNGTLSITHSTVSGNSANDDGGGVSNEETLSITHSTVSGNSAAHYGGGISSITTDTETTTITNSTLSGNSAGNSGGGLVNLNGLITITHSTITDNTAPANEGSGVAGFVDALTDIRVQASIIAGNTATDMDSLSLLTDSFTSLGDNVIGYGNATGDFTVMGDQTGVADPMLGALTNNGGPTETHRPLMGSPAIDAVTGTCPPPDFDQRGVMRPEGTACDIGSVEVLACGNGVVDPGEECDDGNLIDGDGCSAICEIENQPPVAQCQDVSVATDPGLCTAAIASIDNGSSDPDGDPLALNQSPAGLYPLGDTAVTLTVTDPSNASDMCSATVTVSDTEAPALTCPADQTVECSGPSGTPANFSPTLADNCPGPLSSSCSPASGSSFALGETEVTCMATDNAGNAATACNFTVTVEDTTAPTIDSLSTSPSVLWPPNHKMVGVSIAASASDGCDTAPECAVTEVSSNEPIDGLGDGSTAPDWEITGPASVNLRAERAGSGSGRVYTVEVACTDDSGNTTSASTEVTVPLSQKK